MEKVRKEARRKLDLMRKLKRWHKLVTAMAGVVVFCTTYALILPAITMTTPLVCEREEHTHTDECYTMESAVMERTLTCQLTETGPHAHAEGCYTEVTVPACGLTETEGHSHTGECYTETTNNLCGLTETEGHTHGEACRTLTRGELICDKEFDTVERQVETTVERDALDENGEAAVTHETVLETVTESVPHVHTDGCFAWAEELTCGLEESEAHTHTAACAETERVLICGREEAEPHTHSSDCGVKTQKVLICEQEETEGHAHTGECYDIPENEGETVEIPVLTCEMEEHTHDDNCYYGLELEEKVVCYCGYLTQHTHDESCWFEDGALKCNIPEHTHTDECLVKPLPAPEPVDLDETFTAESEDGAVNLTLHVTGTVLLPQAEEPAGGDGSQEETGFELVLTESEDWDAYDEYAGLAAEEGEVVAMGVLDYVLTWNGQNVDLTDCGVVAEVTPTEAFQQFMDDPQTLGLMTLDMVDGEELSAEGEPGEMEIMFTAYTQRQGTVAYALTRGANPTFTVEYYAYLERAVQGADGQLSVIDTDNNGDPQIKGSTGKQGILPRNGATPAVTALYMGDDNKIVTAKTLTQIYKTEIFEYSAAPGLKYINIILTNQKSNYDLKEIWIWDGEGNDWIIHEYDPKLTRITNRPETAETDPNFILITAGSRLRMVYEPKREEERVESNFYDYDVSDGKIYSSPEDAMLQVNGRDVGTQDDKETWAYVNKQGINSNGSVLGFGNAPGSLPTGMGDNTWTDANGVVNKPNQANRDMNKNNIGFEGCTFGLAKNTLNSAGHIQYNISAPYLFNDGQASGKTQLTDRKLGFDRVGDTWTLTSVVQVKDGLETAVIEDLDSFREMNRWGGGKLYSNNFWPLDSLAGTSGHDLKHGDSALANMRKAAGATEARSFPTTDFGGDHNAYFGMQFGVEFSLTKKYVGPLEYYFFGDDDMWIYLVDTETKESKLICDIGGVHTAVGEYVNLWDYIDEDDFLNADGSEKHGEQKKNSDGTLKFDKNGEPVYEDYIKKYELHFYYTERGASGSTCWMQFTLPTAVGLDLEELLEQQVGKDTGSLWIQKDITGVENNQEFEFKLTLNDQAFDNYNVVPMVLGANGELLEGSNALEYIANGDTFKLQAGDILVIKGLPKDTTYTIEELTTAGYHTEITTSVGADSKVESGISTSGTIKVNDTTKVVYTNIASYELPATGGSGTTLWYTMGAMLLLGAAYLMYKKRQWIMREGDAM